MQSTRVWIAALFLASVLFSHTVALRLSLLFAGIALLVFEEIRGTPAWSIARRGVPLAIPFALWGAWALLSYFWSLEPSRTLKEAKNEIGYAMLAFWLCYATAWEARARRIFPPVMALAALAVCAIAAAEFYLLRFVDYMAGLHGGPGSLSSALLTLMPCAVMFAWIARRQAMPAWVQLIAWALPVVFIIAAHTTMNRTVWLGLGAQLAILAGFVLLWNRSAMSPRTAAVVIASTLALAIGASVMLFQVQRERERAGLVAAAGDPRLELWPAVAEKIRERPLAGHGFGRGMFRNEMRGMFHQGELWHSHNLFLDTMLQTGVVGLTLLLLLIGETLRYGWRLIRSQEAIAAACGAALIAVVAGMLVRNTTDVLWVRQNALLYWGVVGVLLAWGHSAQVKQVPAAA
jgi:O-antigen ligase